MILQLFLGDKHVGSIPVSSEESINTHYLTGQKLLLVDKYKEEIVQSVHNPGFYLVEQSRDTNRTR